ncbi:hypothetical protein [Ruficoccus sp. ZRK36]|uniref:GbsR/MarR family transcriptional regulator n=1 Tax=Ruficoccus sp. ZRK36 TaxID=2866311 RepID=UPI001C7335EB|nr:hypothetical protein [Ruficoccus sp. ZRK36]QYY36308.1 hypothetical protein K0V07_02300 [Ruficoccus sp. ZRK36]
MMDTGPSATDSQEVEQEIITLMAGAVHTLGLPRSLGEIYGLLYASPAPLCMDDIIRRLDISLGTASQGLKQLRNFRAVRIVHQPGQRRDYYEPETELRKLLANALSEQFQPRLDAGQKRLSELTLKLTKLPEDTPAHEHLRHRVDKLRQWHENANQLLPLLSSLVHL